MKSVKHLKREQFRPFSKPTAKVRDVWSRFATTVSASSFTGAAVVGTYEALTTRNFFRIFILIALGVIMLIFAVYVVKGGKENV